MGAFFNPIRTGGTHYLSAGFTKRVKLELAALPPQKSCCQKSELTALIGFSGLFSLRGRGQMALVFETEIAAVAKRALVLLKAAYGIKPLPKVDYKPYFGGRRSYRLTLSAEDSRRLLLDQGMIRESDEGERFQNAPRRMPRRICCRRAYLRGAFLAAGFVNDPGLRYHACLEIDKQTEALYLLKVLELCDLKASLYKKNGRNVLSFSEGEAVATLLKTLGAFQAVLYMEDKRAEKSLNAGANRAVNCDQANLKKQLLSAQKQLQAIEALSLSRGLTSLPDELETLARLRISNPEASLEALGKMMDPPLSKSALKRRMDKIAQAASELALPSP